MTKNDVKKVMKNISDKYEGIVQFKTHKNGGDYIQYCIYGWNNNLDYYPGLLSLRLLTDQTGGTGMQGREPRASRDHLSKMFNIPELAMRHKKW